MSSDRKATAVRPAGPDGRLRALYAACAAGLDIAGFVARAVWLLCLFGLIVLAGSAVAAAVQAVI